MFSKLNLIFILLLPTFFSIAVFSMDEKSSIHDFIKMDETSGHIECAFTSYLSQDGKTTIDLIGIMHMATPDFYDSVHNRIKDQVVLYEMPGYSVEDSRELTKRIASLGQIFKKIWDARYVDEIPDSIGCVRQGRYLSFDGCAEPIHADKKEEEALYFSVSDTDIKAKIFYAADKIFLQNGIEIQGPDELLNNISRLPFLEAASKSKKGQSSILRRSIQEMFEDEISLSLGNKPEGLIKHFGENWKEFMDDRHEIVFQKLIKLWAQKEIPARIPIVYGAGHMPYFEEFLKKNNYKLRNKEWLLAAKISPVIEGNKISSEIVEKVYISSNGFLKFYLKDTRMNDNISENDAAFIQDCIMGTVGAKDKLNNIRYTPANFEYVEENLLRLGFKNL